MKQAVYLIIWMGMLLVGSSCSHKAEKDMPMRTISVTVEPLRYFTEVIAGDKFKVVSMVPKGSSPETYDPTPQQLVSLGGSDAYLRIGYIGFEQIWMDKLAANAPDMLIFDMSESVDLIREEEPDHGDHRHEGGVEPHIWNSTQNAHIIADNIYKAVQNFEDRSYARMRGIIFNRRNIPGEEDKVKAFASERGLSIIGDIPRNDDISRFEEEGCTVVEGDRTLPISRNFLSIAEALIGEKYDAESGFLQNRS